MGSGCSRRSISMSMLRPSVYEAAARMASLISFLKLLNGHPNGISGLLSDLCANILQNTDDITHRSVGVFDPHIDYASVIRLAVKSGVNFDASLAEFRPDIIGKRHRPCLWRWTQLLRHTHRFYHSFCAAPHFPFD